MERHQPVNHDVPFAAQPAASARTSWSSPENQPALLNLMEDLLGSHAEPDPLFFVETWTLGIDQAAQSFQSRHQTPANSNAATSAFRSFDFTAPVVFIQDVLLDTPRDAHDFSSTRIGFSVAWKDAYGSSPHASTVSYPSNAAPSQDELPLQPTLPISTEDACRLLGVSPTSTRKQIKTAYRQLVWRYHPDRLACSSESDRRLSTDRMTAINEAYRLLSEAHPAN